MALEGRHGIGPNRHRAGWPARWSDAYMRRVAGERAGTRTDRAEQLLLYDSNALPRRIDPKFDNIEDLLRQILAALLDIGCNQCLRVHRHHHQVCAARQSDGIDIRVAAGDVNQLERDRADLRERMARLEGLFGCSKASPRDSCLTEHKEIEAGQRRRFLPAAEAPGRRAATRHGKRQGGHCQIGLPSGRSGLQCGVESSNLRFFPPQGERKTWGA